MAHQSQNEKEQERTQWHANLKRGLNMLYGEYQPDQEMKAFLARWGGIDRETFVRVLAEGQGVERLLAICVLGESNLPQAQTLLLPFLQSIHPQEQMHTQLYAPVALKLECHVESPGQMPGPPGQTPG
jgi:hypothetical protein